MNMNTTPNDARLRTPAKVGAGLFVSWMILKGPAWLGYVIGVWVIGIADLAFLFSMVAPGVIALNAGTVGGPVIWFLALLITPFGLPPIFKSHIPA